MDARQLNKAFRTVSYDKSELAWAPCCCSCDRMVRDAKRSTKRATRRIGNSLVAMGIDEYEEELELDAAHEEYMDAQFQALADADNVVRFYTNDIDDILDREDEDIQEKCSSQRLTFHYIPQDAGFFGDYNHPGVVYWSTSQSLLVALEALRENGGGVWTLSRSYALELVSQPDAEFMDGFPWNLRKWATVE